MTLKEFLTDSIYKLKNNKIKSANLDVKLITSDYFSYEFHELIINENKIVTNLDLIKLNTKINRRLNGEPVAYIIGYKYFYKDKFYVNKDVLVPRPETELLVEEAISWAKGREGKLNILDLGAGSGCLGLSVLRDLKNAELTSIELCRSALEVAKENANNLGLLSRTNFICEDIRNINVNLFSNKFNIVLANPPYIDEQTGFVEENVKKFEPKMALFSEDEGLKDIEEWSGKVSQWLKSDGIYLMEFGDNQSAAVNSYFTKNNFFVEISIHKDYSSLPRYIKAINK